MTFSLRGFSWSSEENFIILAKGIVTLTVIVARRQGWRQRSFVAAPGSPPHIEEPARVSLSVRAIDRQLAGSSTLFAAQTLTLPKRVLFGFQVAASALSFAVSILV